MNNQDRQVSEMDPISKALERAKRDRQSVRNWVQPAKETPAQGRAPLRSEAPNKRERIQLDPDVLYENKLLCGNANEDPVITDRYRLLRTQVLRTMQINGWRSLGVTSPGAKAGKTVTAINLALSIAREGNYHVTLIDADIRKPAAARYLGVEASVGLPDFLNGNVLLSEICLEISNPNLDFVAGESRSNERPSPDLLKKKQVEDLIKARDQYSESGIVIVDLPPVIIGDDVLAVAANLDSLVLVIDEGSTTTEELEQSVALLSEFNLLGTILNRSTMNASSDSSYHYQYEPVTDDQMTPSESADNRA